MKVAWFSCGCSSLVASKLSNPDKVIYIHVSNQHPDVFSRRAKQERKIQRSCIKGFIWMN